MALDNWGSGKLVEAVEHGVHVDLCCKNHQGKRWSTKNIAPLGCRKIFYNLMGNAPDGGPECDCPLSDLVPTGEAS